MIKEICDATGKLARFPAPFSSDLPGLFVACDDGHETYPFAPGVVRALTSPSVGGTCATASRARAPRSRTGGVWQATAVGPHLPGAYSRYVPDLPRSGSPSTA